MTNLALYFSILPSAACFILKSHFDDTTSLLFGLGTISHTSFFIMDWYSSVMASAHSFFWMASSKHVGSSSRRFAHQSRVTGEWLWSFHLSRSSFWNTILLSILNELSCPSRLYFMGGHLRRFLNFCYIVVLRILLIRGSYEFPYWFYNSRNFPHGFCNPGIYRFLFIYFFKLVSS